MKKQRFTLLTLLFISFSAAAQEYKDCASALQICDKQTLRFDYSEGVGDITDFDDICFDGQFTMAEEYNSVWLEWDIEKPGNFYFTITPNDESTDLDFYVFKKSSSGNCDDKMPVRCMSSGAVVGAPPSSWEACTGATGLSPDETDTEEYAGCRTGDNNFVAALDCFSGESYALAITNFSQDSLGFQIEFFGTAELICEPVSVFSKNNILNRIKVNPNPAADFAEFEFLLSKNAAVSLAVHDARGKRVANLSENERLTAGNHTRRFETGDFPEGIYFFSLRAGEVTVTKSFLIQR